MSGTMTKPVLISASLLSADMSRLSDAIESVADVVDYIHCDIMDGHFVPNLTFGPPVVKAMKRVSRIPLDVHLMIERPSIWIDRFLSTGLTHGDFLVFHIEAEKDPREALRKIRNAGVGAGLSIKPNTPVSAIEPYIDQLDQILVMTVEPGFGGQKYIPETTPKIKQARELSGDNSVIAVDGGIDRDTVFTAVSAGANLVVAGNAIFNTNNVKVAVEVLRGASRVDLT